MANTDSKIRNKIAVRTNIAEPNQFRVIFLNDAVTTAEFVAEVLMLNFNYNQERAIEITKTIDAEGSATVAVLPYEIAEQKGVEVTMLARNNGFPLQVKLEENV
jgi:ATP-dependent Clp protease adaptor protein ClpS